MKKLLLFILIVISILYILPIFFTFTNSFMSDYQVQGSGISLIPDEFTLNQYFSIITTKAQYFQFFLNSVVLTFAIISGQLIVGIMAAFSFAKLKFKGRNIIFGMYVMAILLPFQVTLVPNYLMIEKIQGFIGVKLMDTHWAIILPGIFTSFGIFLLRQFMRGIPNEIIESARMDGAGYFRILFKIVIPMIRPAIFTMVVLTFIDNWNLIEQAIIFISTPAKLPLSVFLDNIYQSDYTVFFAGAVLYIIPAAFLFLKGEKYLSEGLMIGGSK